MTQLPIQKERLEKIASWRETYGAGHNVMLPAEEAEALARFALAAREQELVAIRDENPSFEIMPGESEYDRLKRQWEWMEKKNHAASIPAAVPDDVNGPLAHAYKELTPTFMRNHIAVFERYGITPPNDSLVVIQALRIALDGMERRAAMLNGGKS